jgi:hypothetical protein
MVGTLIRSEQQQLKECDAVLDLNQYDDLFIFK